MFPTVKIANRAISGDTTEDVLNRMPGIYAVDARKAFIMLANNDFIRNDDPAVVFGRYSRIIDLLRAQDVQVYVISTLFCNVKKQGSCAAVNAKTNILNRGSLRFPASCSSTSTICFPTHRG